MKSYLCWVNQQELVAAVENAIQKLGLAQDEARADENGQWILKTVG